MPLETGTYISDLNSSNPPGSDGLNQADDHLRLIKATIKATFPNISAAVTATAAGLNGSHTAGAIQGFITDPGSSVVARGASAAGTEPYVEPDGSVYNISTFPTLGALLTNTYGGNGTTTFGVPDWKTTGKFLRHRTGSVTVGTAQSNQNLSHTHTFSGTTGNQSADHTHSVSVNVTGSCSGTTASGTANLSNNSYTFSNYFGPNNAGSGFKAVDFNTAATVTDTGHTHSFSGSITGTASGTSGGISAGHNHTYSGATSTGSADGAEARPEAFVIFYAIKT